MSIVATAPVPAYTLLANVDTAELPTIRPGCPAWCTGHPQEPLFDGETHYGARRTIVATTSDLGGKVTESHEIDLDIMAVDDAEPAVWLGIAGDTPMTAASARELAAALVALADQIERAR